MKNYRLAAICLLSAVSLAACSPAGTNVSFPNMIQVENGESQSTIEVSGRETVKIEPDKESITYAISTQNADSAICQQENTKNMNALVDYLKEQGFEDASISTSGFTMNPLYAWSGSEGRVTGYEMRTQITVSDVEMDQVGGLLSGGVAQGANEIQQVQYYSSNYDAAYNQALEKAITSAKTKAETMAHADNYQVIDLLHVTENGNNQYGRYVDAGIYQNSAMKESASAAVDMAVMPGQMEVTADITVEFSILPQ